MKQVLLFFNESKYKDECQSIETYTDEIQEAVDAFNNLGYSPITNSELNRLFTTTDDLLFDKMTEGKSMQMGGLEIDKSKAIEILKKPSSYDDVKKLVSVVVNIMASTNNSNPLKNIKNIESKRVDAFYELDSLGKIIVKASIYQSLKEQNQVFAKSDIALKLFDLVTTIKEKCSDPDLSKIIAANPDGLPKILKGVLKEPSIYVKSVELDPIKLAKYNQPGYVY